MSTYTAPNAVDDDTSIEWTDPPPAGPGTFYDRFLVPFEDPWNMFLDPGADGVVLRGRGLQVDLEVANPWDKDCISVYWGDGTKNGDISWWSRAETHHDSAMSRETGTGPRTIISHTYDRPGRYSVEVYVSGPGPSAMQGQVQLHYESWALVDPITGKWDGFEVTDLPETAYGVNGYAVVEDDEASTTRRAGRKVWAGSRLMPDSWWGSGQSERNQQADRVAARMRRRVRGRERTRTLNTVPAPWLMPGDIIEAELSDGVPTQKHVIQSVTVPLAPSPQGQTIRTVHHDQL